MRVNGKISWKKLILNLLLTLCIGFLGSFAVRNGMDFYQSLKLPPFAPPDWIFAPVWTILYVLMGIAAYRISMYPPQNKKALNAYYVYLIQLFFNFMWTGVFFYFESPVIALVIIITLLLLIIATIKRFYEIDKTAALLLIPYLLWTAYAVILNAGIAYLN